jgi:hypothetical protein
MRALWILLPLLALTDVDQCLAGEGQTLRGHVPQAVRSLNLRAVGRLAETNQLTLAIGLPWRNQESLRRLLRQIYDPSSPDYHHYLTPAEFSQRFAPTEQDYAAVIAFARSQGLEPVASYGNRVLLDVRGSVSSIERSLHVKMNVFQHPREARTFYAPDREPSLDLAVPVLHISGLDDYTRPHPCGMKPRPLGGGSGGMPLAGTGSGLSGSFTAHDLRTAYVPGISLTGSGQVVGLFELDGYYTNDIGKYEQMSDLTNMPLQNVYLDNFNGTPSSGEYEVALDIEMVMAMAPGLAKIVVYEGGPNGMADDILNCMATNNMALQLSCSWSFDIDATTEQIFQELAAQGQSFFQASGDFGAYSGGVEAPCDNPYITIVGGTTLTTAGAGGAWASETVWSGSGGGVSTTYPIPAWQAGVNMSSNMGSSKMRNIPDVSLVANSVFSVVENGIPFAGIGTSAAAPLWAAFTALANQQGAAHGQSSLGFINPAIYAMGEGTNYDATFHDITTGNNTNAESPDAYYAVAGYDLCSGWGTPKGSNIINVLAPPDALVMLPVSGILSTGRAGGPFSVTTRTYSLTNEGSASLSWSFQSDVPWLSASPTNGTLDPGATDSVVVELNAASSNLPVGSHYARVTLTDLSNGLLHHRYLSLQISNPLAVLPAAGLEYAGPPSGPFNVAAEDCALTNAGHVAVNWSVVTNPPWLNVSPTNGTLEPLGSTLVKCSLNAAATNLPTGAYYTSLVFSNITFGGAESLPLVFLIGQLVQNGGFESGSFTDWTLTEVASESFVSTNTIAVHSGSYGAELGELGGLAYLSQTIPTIPGSAYSISLWLDSPDGQMTNEFLVSWGGRTLFDYTNLPAIGWTNLQFTVSATETNTVLKMGFRDDTGYLGLDDISVTATPPILSSATPSVGPALGGTTVTITGSGFQTHAKVAFGSVPAASLTFNSGSNLTVVTPGSSTVGLVNIVITNADGQATLLTNGFFFIGTPVVTWTNPPALTYGVALGATQLNASAIVQGSFSFVPPAGSILAAGTNRLSAVFTPLDESDYVSVTNYVDLVVTPAPLSVTASNASRSYGVNNPPLSGLIAGLRNGDDITATYACAATPSSPAGPYLIVPSLTDTGGRLPNYKVTTVDGTMTILTPVPPEFKAVVLSADKISFNWTATIGVAYQVQYSSFLPASTWKNLGGLIIATNALPVMTDSVTNSQRLFRVLLVPQ